VKELVGFKRVTLAPGETRDVAITIAPRAFALWNAEMQRVTEPGTFAIMTGANSAELQTAKLEVKP
jgi:beta-glucosidase